MIPVTDPFMADVATKGLQKGRGGFLRAANDTPWVTHPDGVIVATGPRKGEPLRIPYAQPSGVGRLIENDVGLTKYKQRNTLLGIGMSVELREACIDLAVLEAGGDEFRKAADTIVVEADNLTRSWLAADRGSHGHLLCECHDKQIPFAHLVEDGERLGLDKSTQIAVVQAWVDLLRDNGLEILAIEASCVDDRWRLAGTLDRIVRCTRELRFARPDGTIVIIPAGTVLILDIKFGQIRRAHLIQCASYRQSVPYDTDLETRGVWPWPISADHALIAHGDFGGDGVPVSFELVWIDLQAGREHGGRCVADAKTWSTRDDLWSVAQLDVPGISVTLGTPDVEGAGKVDANASPSTPVSPLAANAVNAGAVGSSADQPPHPPATIQAEPVTFDFVAGEIRQEALAWASQPAPAPLAPLPDRPDEGFEMDWGWDSLKEAYELLPVTDRAWISRLVSEAQRASVGFHSQGHHTTRRALIIEGLITLANHDTADDDVLRALVTAALHNDAPLDPRHTPGACVGSLDADAAQRFATLVDEYVGVTA